MRSRLLAISTIVALTGAFVLVTTLINTVPVYAKITSQTTCDGEP